MNSNSRQALLDMFLLCWESNIETKLKKPFNFILIKKGTGGKEHEGMKLLQIVVLVQKLTLNIRVYQKLKRHKPTPIRAKQGRAKQPKQFSCYLQ